VGELELCTPNIEDNKLKKGEICAAIFFGFRNQSGKKKGPLRRVYLERLGVQIDI
jgi:hypothetical protein